MTDKKYIEIIYRCAGCGHRKSVVVAHGEITKAPKPCPACGGQVWIQAS